MEERSQFHRDIDQAFKELKERIGEEDAEEIVAIFTEMIFAGILTEYEFLSLLGLT
jgi:frataxin-like iron-binding protein CyaY